jgi:hypothetical protein
MGETRVSRLGLLGVAVVLSSAALLAACAGNPPQPAPVAMSAPISTADAGPPIASDSLGVATPSVRRSFARPSAQQRHIADARRVARHMAAKEHHRSSPVKAVHHKSAKHLAAHRAPQRKHAKVSATTRAAAPKG